MTRSRLIAAMLMALLGMANSAPNLHAANLGEACGGPASVTCNSALWCQRTEGQCKVADAPGRCDKAPAFCMQIHRPVCGCNGKTYANDCERQKAKVQLDHVGACPKEPKPKDQDEGTPKSKTSKGRKP